MNSSHNDAINNFTSGAWLPWACDLTYDLKVRSGLAWGME